MKVVVSAVVGCLVGWAALHGLQDHVLDSTAFLIAAAVAVGTTTIGLKLSELTGSNA